MKQVNGKAVEALLLSETNKKVRAEDHAYELKPISWYTKKPWLGLRKYFYVTAACDCEDFCTIFKYELLRRHLKRAEGGADQGGTSYPALPVFQAKIQLVSGDNHWVLCIVADDGVYFIERTEDSIRFVTKGNYKKIYRIHI